MSMPGSPALRPASSAFSGAPLARPTASKEPPRQRATNRTGKLSSGLVNGKC